jgi:amino acid adenylation domain-containing protein
MTSRFELTGTRQAVLLRLLEQQGGSVDGYPRAGHVPNVVPLRNSGGLPPLSFAQERMWFFQRLHPDSAAYNLPAVLRLRGKLDAVAFGAALHRVLEGHEVLRTLLGDEGGRPIGVVGEFADPVRHHDVGDADDPMQAGLTLVLSILTTPFDLAAGPLVRVALIRIAEEEHLLVLDMHHVAGDAWSWDILLAQLATEMTAPSPPIAEDALQYGDWAAWQRACLERGELDEQLAYWREQLHALPSPIEVIGDRPRQPRPRHRGALIRGDIDAAVAARLQQLAPAEHSTPFMVFLAAGYALLHLVTGQTDLLVGSPVAERRRPELDHLVGILVNTLALRVRVDATGSFRALLADVRRTVVDATERQAVPFERVAQEALASRDAAPQTPLFHVMFAYRSAPARREVHGLQLDEVEIHNQTSKRDLTLQIVETEGAFRLQLEYDTDRYETASAQALFDAFSCLLRAAVNAPDTPIAALPMLDETFAAVEREAGFGVPLPVDDRTVVDLVRAQAYRTPQRPAVSDITTTLTYAQLVARAEATGAALAEAGAGPGATVGVLLPRTADAVVAVLGVLCCGAAYVPLDPTDPWPRINSLVSAAGAQTVLVDGASGRADLADRVTALPVVTTDPAGIERSSAEFALAARRPRPGDAAYVLFTSGSTGTPKGVVIEHRQLAAYTRAITDRIGLAGPLQHALVQPLGVDSSLTMLFPPLCGGGTVHVVTRETALDPQALADLFSRNRIDTLKIAPSHLRALHRSGNPGALLPRSAVIVGGEASSLRWLESLRRPGLAVHNHYGPTEATVGVTTLSVQSGAVPADPDVTTPLGRPLDGVSIHVLDEQLRLVPRGVPGELCLGGVTVARGYLGLPARTAQAFVPDPYGPPGSRLYRTGDRGRRRPDGTVEFLGRRDDQIKIRGLRVELGEVAAVLRAQPGVADAAAIAQTTRRGVRLVGFVVPAAQPGAESWGIEGFDVAALRERLRGAVPEQLVPAVLITLPQLPLSTHGKVDRAVLLTLASADVEPIAPAGREPVSDMERQVAAIWSRVLGVDRVPTDLNFFDAGGHSLLLVKLHYELQAATGREIALVELFNRTTVAQQAEFVSTSDADQGRERAALLARGRERGRRQGAALRGRQRGKGTQHDDHP